MMMVLPKSILGALSCSTTTDRHQFIFLERDPQIGIITQEEPVSVPKYASFEGSDLGANTLTHEDDGLVRLGADPRITGLQAQAEERAEDEASIADLQSLAAEASKGQQAREVAAALSMRQAQEIAEVQLASVGASGGPRKPIAPQMDPKHAVMLARLSGQARALREGR